MVRCNGWVTHTRFVIETEYLLGCVVWNICDEYDCENQVYENVVPKNTNENLNHEMLWQLKS